MAIGIIILATGVLLYTYILYPLLIAALAKLRPHSYKTTDSYTPRISVILSAYNEEEHLAACLDSLLSQDYPSDEYEIIVGSDGSADSTNAILKKYALEFPSLKIFLFELRRGKMAV